MKKKIFGAILLMVLYIACSIGEGVPLSRENALSVLTSLIEESDTASDTSNVDLNTLSSANSDFCCWLLQDGTGVNAPVMQSEDNNFYMNHGFSRLDSAMGEMFIDARNANNFSDSFTWIYGNGQTHDGIFSFLSQYENSQFADLHPTFTVIVPDGELLLSVYACIKTDAPEEKWFLPRTGSAAEYENYIQAIESANLIDSPSYPAYKQKSAVLCTYPDFYGNSVLVYAAVKPVDFVVTEEDADKTNRMQIPSPLCTLMGGTGEYCKTVMIPGRGKVQYYAQNDPVWSGMIYENSSSTKKRFFGDAACGPTALANALINTADDSGLLNLLNVARNTEAGFRLCPCSVNNKYCCKMHAPVAVETLQDEKDYLPLILGSFACGNNQWKAVSRSSDRGTNPDLFQYAARACGLAYGTTHKLQDVEENFMQGGTAIMLTGGAASPFTGGGHFICAIYADEKYIYFLDPYYKEDYSQTDKKHVLEVLEGGVVRAEKTNFNSLKINGIHLLTPPSNVTQQ